MKKSEGLIILEQNSNEVKEDSIDGNQIIYFLQDHLVQKHKIPEVAAKRIARYMFYVLIGSTASIAGVPFMQPARSFTGDNEALGWVFATGTLITLANVNIWSWLNFIKNSFYSNPTTNLSKRKYAGKIIYALTVVLLGITSSVPALYLTYKYNDEQTFWPVITFFTSLGFRINGFDQFLKNQKAGNLVWFLRTKWARLKKDEYKLLIYEAEQELLNIQVEFAKKFEKAAMQVDKLTQISLFPPNKDDQSLDNAVNEFITNILKLPQAQVKNTPEQWLNGWPRAITKYIGFIFPLAGITLNSILLYRASQLLYDNPIFAAFFILLTITPDATIMILSGMKMFESLYDLAFNKISGNHDKTLTELKYPKAKIIFSLIALLITGFSYGPSSYVMQEYFSGLLKKIMLPGFIIADILFHARVLLENSDSLIFTYINKFGSNQEKNLSELVSSLKKFSSLIKQSSPETFNKFLHFISHGETQEILFKEKLLPSKAYDSNLTETSLGKKTGYKPTLYLHISSKEDKDSSSIISNSPKKEPARKPLLSEKKEEVYNNSALKCGII